MGLYEKISPTLNKGDEDCHSIILFDPSEVYSRITIDKTARRQSLTTSECFPNQKGICGCGCGKSLPKRATRWYTPDHATVSVGIMRVIQGDSDLIRRLLRCYLPLECAYCKKEDYLVEKFETNSRGGKSISFSASGIHVDHIISVKNGGGGCWLGNYQFLCHSCNIQKERTDRLLRNVQPHMPISTEFNF